MISEEETRSCFTCFEDLPLSSFPVRGEEPYGCRPSQCFECWKFWIRNGLDIQGPEHIKCCGVNCDRILEYGEIKQLADKETWLRYQKLLLHQVLVRDPEFHWCLNPNCGFGQLCDRNGNETRDECMSFRCSQCQSDNCLRHGRVHDAETCGNFEDTEEFKEAEISKWKSEVTSKQISRLCPNCNKSIEHTGGCPHMTCPCGQEFCYLCLRKYVSVTKAMVFPGSIPVFRGFNIPHYIALPYHNDWCPVRRDALMGVPSQIIANAFLDGYRNEIVDRLGPQFVEQLLPSEPHLYTHLREHIMAIEDPGRELPRIAVALDGSITQAARLLQWEQETQARNNLSMAAFEPPQPLVIPLPVFHLGAIPDYGAPNRSPQMQDFPRGQATPAQTARLMEPQHAALTNAARADNTPPCG